MRLDQQVRLVRVACGLGVHTLRLTGGEPLLSDRLLPLLEALAAGRSNAADPLAQLQEVALTVVVRRSSSSRLPFPSIHAHLNIVLTSLPDVILTL